jgi:uncharacterized protein YchJ
VKFKGGRPTHYSVPAAPKELCPCGSGLSYRDCTAPYHRPMTQRVACDCKD